MLWLLLQCYPCDKGLYTSSSPGNTMCTPCPRGSTTQEPGSVLADGASPATICSGLPTAAQIQAVMLGRQAVAAFSTEGCAALLTQYGGNISEIGNGLCNPGVHNTPVCGYDGGDCCRSSCIIKVSVVWQEMHALPAKGCAACAPLLPASVSSFLVRADMPILYDAARRPHALSLTYTRLLCCMSLSYWSLLAQQLHE